jgi:4-alpha-glucanotransferase
MDLTQRRGGVVLHFSALPAQAPGSCSGDFGLAAHAFAEWLGQAGLTLWQTLPLTPIGPGDSPYQSPSAFAGNPLLVALEPLVQRGWLKAEFLEQAPRAASHIDWRAVIPWRTTQLAQAADGFAATASATERGAFAAWRASQAHWLADWALYAAIKATQGLRAWWDWPLELRRREPTALAAARRALAANIDAHAFAQWQFDTQLAALKQHANRHGVHLMGDVPIFIAHDSADVWARPDLYRLDANDQPEVVAGVPPDGYSSDGQRWGNPLPRWDRMAAEGYAWWVARVQRLLTQADVFRIDHFRGFAGFWEIPAACPTARDGRWVEGPGAPLFEAIEAQLGRLPIVAEDLGLITPDVVALRERFGWPGMRIVYEGFLHGPAHGFVPHHHERRGLVYSSTHDSDTAAGWWQAASAEQRAFAAQWLGLPLDADARPAGPHQRTPHEPPRYG